MSDLQNILLLALLGSVIALSGGVVFLVATSWTKILTRYSVPFAAGVLLVVSLVGLLPEAVHNLGELAFLIVLGGFLASYLFEHAFFELHHHEAHSHRSKEGSVWLVIIGDTIHNFIDGVAIAATYMMNPGLGLITAVGTFLHEVPHEIGDFGILLRAGWSKKRVLVVNFISALFTVVGALVVYFVSGASNVVGYMIAVAAGMFLYLGASDFLPQIEEEKSKLKSVVALLVGVGLMIGTLMIVPHTHESEGHEEEVIEET